MAVEARCGQMQHGWGDGVAVAVEEQQRSAGGGEREGEKEPLKRK